MEAEGHEMDRKNPGVQRSEHMTVHMLYQSLYTAH